MKANWVERLVVNSPIRLLIQEKIILRWIKSKVFRKTAHNWFNRLIT